MAQEQKKEMTQQEKDQRNTAFGCLFFLLLLALTSLAVYRFINDPRKKNGSTARMQMNKPGFLLIVGVI